MQSRTVCVDIPDSPGGGGGGESGLGGGGGAAPSEPPEAEIVVTGRRIANKVIKCAVGQFGFGEAASIGATVAGRADLGTRQKPAGAVRGTSIASRGASAVFGQAELPRPLPTIVGNPLNRSARFRRTISVARFVGRGVPVAGWGLLAYDAVRIAYCVASDD